MLTEKRITKLKGLREREGLRVEHIAVELGVSSQTVRSWETAKYLPTINLWEVDKWCTTYRCTRDELTEAVFEIKTIQEGQ